MDEELMLRLNHFLIEVLAKCNREGLVYQRFVQELKAEGRVGILEQLDAIRRSPEIQSAQEAYFRGIDELVRSALEGMPMDLVEKGIRSLKPSKGESN